MDGDILRDAYRPSGGEIPLDLCLQMGLLDAVGGTCTASPRERRYHSSPYCGTANLVE